MLDKTSEFLGLAKRELPQVQIVHCFLHRHALASVLRNIKFVLDRVVQAVNFIRPKPLNHRLFRVLCTETGVQHSVLLYLFSDYSPAVSRTHSDLCL